MVFIEFRGVPAHVPLHFWILGETEICAMPSFWVTNKSNLPRSCQGFHYTHYLEVNLSRISSIPSRASKWTSARCPLLGFKLASCIIRIMLQNLNTGTESDRKAHPDQDRDKERVMENWNITEMAVWMVWRLSENAERLDKTRGKRTRIIVTMVVPLSRLLTKLYFCYIWHTWLADWFVKLFKSSMILTFAIRHVVTSPRHPARAFSSVRNTGMSDASSAPGFFVQRPSGPRKSGMPESVPLLRDLSHGWNMMKSSAKFIHVISYPHNPFNSIHTFNSLKRTLCWLESNGCSWFRPTYTWNSRLHFSWRVADPSPSQHQNPWSLVDEPRNDLTDDCRIPRPLKSSSNSSSPIKMKMQRSSRYVLFFSRKWLGGSFNSTKECMWILHLVIRICCVYFYREEAGAA